MNRDLAELRRSLLPAGTRLADPICYPDYRGITWAEYEFVYWRDMAQGSARLNTAPPPELKIATNRDRYGWRSLPAGTRKLSF